MGHVLAFMATKREEGPTLLQDSSRVLGLAPWAGGNLQLHVGKVQGNCPPRDASLDAVAGELDSAGNWRRSGLSLPQVPAAIRHSARVVLPFFCLTLLLVW